MTRANNSRHNRTVCNSKQNDWEKLLVSGILVSGQLQVVVILGPGNPGSLVIFAKVTAIPVAGYPNLGKLVLPVLAVASHDISRWNARTRLKEQLSHCSCYHKEVVDVFFTDMQQVITLAPRGDHSVAKCRAKRCRNCGSLSKHDWTICDGTAKSFYLCGSTETEGENSVGENPQHTTHSSVVKWAVQPAYNKTFVSLGTMNRYSALAVTETAPLS